MSDKDFVEKLIKGRVAESIFEIVEEILSHYTSVFLFLATPEGFYYESCEVIKRNGGKISKLLLVDDEIQEKYLRLLKEFIQ